MDVVVAWQVMFLVWAFDEQVRLWGLGPEEILVIYVLVIYVVYSSRSVFPSCHLCGVLPWKTGSGSLNTSQGSVPGGCQGGHRIVGGLLELSVMLFCRLWMLRGRMEIVICSECPLSAEHLEAV